jgi:hypothetical protein
MLLYQSFWAKVLYQHMRSALFWDITRRHVVIIYRRSVTTYRSHLQGSRVREDGTDTLSMNVGKQLPHDAQMSSTSRRKPEIRVINTSYCPLYRYEHFNVSRRWRLLRLIIKASRSYSDTPHSVGLLWTSDQPVAETSTWQHTILTRDRQPCPRWDSKPQSQQASGRRPTP